MDTGMLFPAVLVLALAMAMAISYVEMAKVKRKLRRYSELAFRDGYRECGVCGKLYKPLNSPDHQPELDICRDCLWKLHYRQTFDVDDSR